MPNFKIGNELTIKTKLGQVIKGIFLGEKDKYISTLGAYGIIVSIPCSLIEQIVRA